MQIPAGALTAMLRPPAESGNEEIAAAAGRMLTSVIFSAASTQGGVIKTRWVNTHAGHVIWIGVLRPGLRAATCAQPLMSHEELSQGL